MKDNLPCYRDPARSVDDRTKDILSRMTVEEKLAQLRILVCPWKDFALKDAGRPILTDKFKSQLCGTGVGALQCLVRGDVWTRRTLETGFNRREGAELINEAQRQAIENSRLKIPLLIIEDCRHGLPVLGATQFPCGIAQAASWNRDLLKSIGGAIGAEMRSQGVTVSIGPNLCLARDPRWGRMEETYGEDPWLAGRLGAAYIQGLQEETPQGAVRAVAAMIFLGGMGDGENGLDARPVRMGKRELKEIVLRPFAMGARAGALGVMASYSDIDGIPCHANRELLTDILRTDFGFKGFVQGDGDGLWYLWKWHGIAQNLEEAAAAAARAGLDMDLYLEGHDVYGEPLRKALERGLVSVADIDVLVYRVLRVKFSLGLFEQPYSCPEESERIARSKTHVSLSLDAARQCITLLKNENSVLPLKKGKIRSIAVIGPHADNIYNQLGDYTPFVRRESVVTLLDGIRAMAPEGCVVRYARGCGIRDASKAGFPQAIATAQQSDVAVIAIGTSSNRYVGKATDEAIAAANQMSASPEMDCGEGNDRVTLELLGAQKELVDEIEKTGKPIVVVLIHGRPICMPEVVERADAIVDAWYPGEQGGAAIAEALFGKYNPAGRLPVSIPRHSGQLPVFYNTHRPARKGYIEMSSAPQYQFGYGLSYTSFRYDNLSITPDNIPTNGSTIVSVDVTNIGSMVGDEVVQLYIRDEYSSMVRPERELRGFERIHLQTGETRRVEFPVGPEALCFYGIDMEWVVEPGEFSIMVGPNANQCLNGILTCTQP